MSAAFLIFVATIGGGAATIIGALMFFVGCIFDAPAEGEMAGEYGFVVFVGGAALFGLGRLLA